MKKECKNCIHHQGVQSLDDCPAICYSCVASPKDKPSFEAVTNSQKKSK